MQIDDAETIERAIDWHIRQAELTEDGWQAFVAWLEVPANALAYDRVALDDRLLDEVRFPATAANDTAPLTADDAPKRRWPWALAGSALAASLVALLAPSLMPTAADPYRIQTRAGERRSVQLADGTRIEMNGGTSLQLDRADARIASLESGQAVFHVTHDARHPFAVRSGDILIRDVGTVFDVARSGSRLDVQVAEGSVLFQPDREALLLKPGNALTAQEKTHELIRSTVAPAIVGGWREGTLSFTGETLDTVFASIQRQYGIDVRLEAGLPHRPFTGMVQMTGAADRDIPHLAALIGARVRRDGEQWILAPDASGAR